RLEPAPVGFPRAGRTLGLVDRRPHLGLHDHRQAGRGTYGTRTLPGAAPGGGVGGLVGPVAVFRQGAGAVGRRGRGPGARRERRPPPDRRGGGVRQRGLRARPDGHAVQPRGLRRGGPRSQRRLRGVDGGTVFGERGGNTRIVAAALVVLGMFLIAVGG